MFYLHIFTACRMVSKGPASAIASVADHIGLHHTLRIQHVTGDGPNGVSEVHVHDWS